MSLAAHNQPFRTTLLFQLAKYLGNIRSLVPVNLAFLMFNPSKAVASLPIIWPLSPLMKNTQNLHLAIYQPVRRNKREFAQNQLPNIGRL